MRLELFLRHFPPLLHLSMESMLSILSRAVQYLQGSSESIEAHPHHPHHYHNSAHTSPVWPDRVDYANFYMQRDGGLQVLKSLLDLYRKNESHTSLPEPKRYRTIKELSKVEEGERHTRRVERHSRGERLRS